MLVSPRLLPLARRLGCQVGDRSRLAPRTLRAMRGRDARVGRDCILSCRLSFDRAEARVRFGDRCYVGASHLVAAQDIELGDDVVISWGTTIVDHNSHALDFHRRRSDVLDWGRGIKDWSTVATSPVRICARVWIGFNAIILKGVTIGENAIVGAGAVVTKDVAPFEVVAGNPARTVRTLENHDA